MLNAKNSRGNHPITPLPKASAKGPGKQFHINTARYFLITQWMWALPYPWSSYGQAKHVRSPLTHRLQRRSKYLLLAGGQSPITYLPGNVLRKLFKRFLKWFLHVAHKDRAAGVPSWSTCLWVAILFLLYGWSRSWVQDNELPDPAPMKTFLRIFTLKVRVQRGSLDATAQGRGRTGSSPPTNWWRIASHRFAIQCTTSLHSPHSLSLYYISLSYPPPPTLLLTSLCTGETEQLRKQQSSGRNSKCFEPTQPEESIQSKTGRVGDPPSHTQARDCHSLPPTSSPNRDWLLGPSFGAHMQKKKSANF